MHKKTFKPIVGAAFIASIAISPLALSAENPFQLKELSSGYQLAGAEKDAEGKCGEGKCGDDKKEAKADGEGKCGEGKCGDDKEAAKADAEGKCGEGKCGDDMGDEATGAEASDDSSADHSGH